MFKVALAILTRVMPLMLHSRFEDIMSLLTALNSAPIDIFDADKNGFSHLLRSTVMQFQFQSFRQ